MIKDQLDQQLRTLTAQNYPWFDQKKSQDLSALLNQQTVGDLRNRQSHLHLSASVIFFIDQQLLMVDHPYLHQLLLPAGHVEGDEIPLQTAIREFEEETGYTFEGSLKSQLVDVNQIAIPANPLKQEGAHYHLDWRYYIQGEIKAKGPAELHCYRIPLDQVPQEFIEYGRYFA